MAGSIAAGLRALITSAGMPLEWIRFTCSFEMNNDGIGMVEVGRHLSDKNGIVFRNIKDPGYVERIIRENAKLHE